MTGTVRPRRGGADLDDSSHRRPIGASVGIGSGIGGGIGLLAAPMLGAEAPLAIVAGAALGVVIGLLVEAIAAANGGSGGGGQG